MNTQVQSPWQELLSTAPLLGQAQPAAGASEVNRTAAPVRTFLAVTSIPVGTNPVGLAFIPNGDLYVANSGSNNVQTIDTATDTVTGAAIPTGTVPVWLTVAPNGSAYVPNNVSNSVTVIDTATSTVLTTIALSGGPAAAAVIPSGNVYVSRFTANSVQEIDTTTNAAVGAAIPTGSGPVGIAVAPNGKAYVANRNGNTVTVIDTATSMVLTTIPVGAQPNFVAIAPNGNAYVANIGSNNVSVINTVSDTVVGAPIPVGANPWGITAGADGHVYTANRGSNDVSVIDSVTNTVIGAPIPVGSQPIALVVAPNNKVYVTNIAGASVSVIQFDPTITSISPNQGPIAGGTPVTITGTNLTGATVTIGGNPATGVTVNSTGTQITAITPPGVAGPADVTVTTPGGSATLVGGFTYLLPVHATSLTATPALTKLFPPHVFFPFLTATLTDQVTGLPVPNQPILFKAGSNVLGIANTDAQGVARVNETLTLTLILLHGGYEVSFAGAVTPTAILSPSSASAPVIEP
ncbi:IPT/TIG domain-containing protein [Streptomyces sp. N2A]|uniref:virginiamycin B lyase family protein n=1 Tax=Streptomyces sp. N2A TaxID=3073936 RepID=UPI0028704B00|nr:IPT/TIG domain-containing protein [Streptomyces sp. N2A]